MHFDFSRGLICALAIVFWFSAGAALAQEGAGASPQDRQPWSVRSGIGFTAGPDLFLMGFELDRALDANVSAGVTMHLGVKSDVVLVSPFVYGRYAFPLRVGGEGDSEPASLRPYAQMGIGFTHLTFERPNDSWNGDTAFLMSFGGGIEYQFNDRLSFGSQMLFNALPGDAHGDSFYYSWEIATIRYRFD